MLDDSDLSEYEGKRGRRKMSVVSMLSGSNVAPVSYASSVSGRSSVKESSSEDEEEETDDFVPSKNFGFRFSREQLLDLKRVFDAYDDNSDGIIDIHYLGVVLRASNLILTEKDIVDIMKKADPEETGEIGLGKFFVIAARRFRDWAPIEKMARKAFTKISKSNMVSGQDDIPLAALRNVLIARGGEQFVESEVEEFMKDVQVISDRKRSTVSVLNLVAYAFGDESIEVLAKEAEKTMSAKRRGSSSGKFSGQASASQASDSAKTSAK